MATTLINAVLLDLDPLSVRMGALRIEGGRIVASGGRVSPRGGDEVLDCGGAVVMPGLVNGHGHLYSALAVGMPSPAKAPRNFPEILERLWWRLDRALDGRSVETSGLIGALDALHCGTTTLIDHHSSPNCIAGSLDMLERGIDAVGLRGVLCYEVTDRHGAAGAMAGLEENRRYLRKSQNAPTSCLAPPRAAGSAAPRAAGWHAQAERGHVSARFAGMVGAHAAFTLSDDSLEACVRLAAELNTGVHIHVAEDPCDDLICRRRYGAPLLTRLRECGLLDRRAGVAARSILAHGTHLPARNVGRISAQVAAMAHNPRSNMNNAVGYAPVARMSHVALGTDGIGSDMFTEARFAWLKARDAGPTRRGRPALTPVDIVGMLAHSAHVASGLLGVTVGRLTPGAAADVVITDYRSATSLDAANAAGHLLFGIGPQHVRHVLIGGDWVLRDRRAVRLDEEQARHEAASIARELWSRLPRR